jgi:hypothetical protein
VVLYALMTYRPVGRDARYGEAARVRRREADEEGTWWLAVEARGGVDCVELTVEPSLRGWKK